MENRSGDYFIQIDAADVSHKDRINNQEHRVIAEKPLTILNMSSVGSGKRDIGFWPSTRLKLKKIWDI